MRKGGVVYYLLGDHLGSTSLVLNAGGAVHSRARYYPYGETRWTAGTLPTDYRFTGQRRESGLGLYQMGARWYDPALGRWLSADTVVPQPEEPQGLNRYSYVRNSPLVYLDPSGHVGVTPKPIMIDGMCFSPEACPPDPEPMVPIVPDAPPEGDPATPVQVGMEWLIGKGPRHHEFRDEDYFTDLLQEHDHLDKVRRAVVERARIYSYRPGRGDYKLDGLQGIPKYIKDYSTVLTAGRTGNLAVTFLGSFRLEYYILEITPEAGTVKVLFHVHNRSTLTSATRPPVVGYWPIWQKYVAPLLNDLVKNGPGSEVTQDFWWNETINYDSE